MRQRACCVTSCHPSPLPPLHPHPPHEAAGLLRELTSSLPPPPPSSSPLQEAACLLRDLALLHPELCTLSMPVRDILSEQASAGVVTLGPRELAELVAALAPLLAEEEAEGAKGGEEEGAATRELYASLLVGASNATSNVTVPQLCPKLSAPDFADGQSQ